MKISEVFCKAAELRATCNARHGCCDCIGAVAKNNYAAETDALYYFDELYRPNQPNSAMYYFDYPDGSYTSTSKREDPKLIREQRVFALLLASEIAKSEGL